MADKIWRLLSSFKNTENLTRETGISSIKARLLINRGIDTPKDINSFLFPRLSGLIEPLLLKDMEEGAALVLSAIEKQESIAIFGELFGFDTLFGPHAINYVCLSTRLILLSLV